MDSTMADWHLDKSVSIGHIISTMLVAGSVFVWVNGVDGVTKTNRQSIEYLMERQKLVEERVTNIRMEIKADLRDINEKLDRLIERQK